MRTMGIVTRKGQFLMLVGLITLMCACGGSEKKDERLQKAYELHLESVGLREEAGKHLEEMINSTDSGFLNSPHPELDSATHSLKEWDEQLVEVPGFEEEEHEGHHHHHHGEQQQLTPEQHLEVQQQLLSEIKQIASDIDQIQTQL